MTSSVALSSLSHSDDAEFELVKSLPPTSEQWQSLPSTNPAEIELELYLRLARLPFQVVESAYPYSSVTQADLPLLRYDVDVMSGSRNAIEWLQQYVCNIDENRNPEELAEIVAFKSLVYEKLIPAVEYIQWADHTTYNTITASTYAEHTPYIIRKVLTQQKRAKILLQCHERGVESLERAMQLIEEAYTALSTRLGIRRTFFNSRPSTLDVLVASHVAVHVHAPWPENPVKRLLQRKHKRLVKHSADLLADLWPTQPVQELASPIKPTAQADYDEQYAEIKSLPPARSKVNRPAATLNAQAGASTQTSSREHTVQFDGSSEDAEEEQRASELQRTNRLVFFSVFSAFLGYVGWQRWTAQSSSKQIR